ncbi:MAG: hypothetical protein M3P30_15380 [Chloroflexota bacterium]|nr:hypothetical protein [Chloroflexota bacterium]
MSRIVALIGALAIATTCSTACGDGSSNVTAPNASGAFVVVAGVDVPLLIDGDRLAVSSLTRAAPTPITGPGKYADVGFDAAGRIIYVDSSGANPGFYRVEDGQPRLVIPAALEIYSSAARWAPDAARAAWIEADGRLRVAKPLEAPAVFGPEGLADFLWSPDGTRLIAWTADRKLVSIIAARDGTTTATSAPVPASWSSAGDIAALEMPAGGSPLWTLVLAHEDGASRRELGGVYVNPEGPLPVPAFSPDGRWFARNGAVTGANAATGVILVDTRTGEEVSSSCPACGAGSEGYGPEWSPDGRSLAWTQGDHVVVARTGDWSGAIVADGTPLSWSPDGSALAYLRVTRPTTDSVSVAVYERPLDGGSETMIVALTDARGLSDQMAWSPDGKQIVVPLQAAESSRLLGFRPENGDLKTFTLAPPNTVPALLSPDGSAIYDPGSQVVRPIDGADILRVGPGQVTDWSRDGQRMLVVGAGLNEVHLSTGVRTKLLDGNLQDAVWSPDERRIAFVRDQRLGVLDLASGKAIMIASDLTAVYLPVQLSRANLQWSPDGKQIAVGDWSVEEPTTQGRSDIYLVDADGGHLTRLTDSASGKLYYTFAPDGRHLAYFNERTAAIEIVDLKTLAITVVAGIDSAQFAWTGSKALLADTPQGIALLQLDGTSRLIVAQTGGCFPRLIGWIGAQLVFSNFCSHQGL